MRHFLKKTVAAVLTLGVLFGTLGGSIVYADTENNEGSSLGASAACARHTLGTFSGVPACVNANGDLHICAKNFPDEVFRKYVANLEGAEEGYFTPEECGKIEESLNVCDNDDIKTLQGIEFFTRLKSLNCDRTGVSELDVSNNIALAKLSCRQNHIQKLNISGCTELVELDCAYNDLTELNVGHNTQLVYLDCCFNQLTRLDVSDCRDLSVLICSNNNMTELFTNRRDGNWENLIVSPQTSTLPLVKRGAVWTADLRSLVEDISRIETDGISEGTYDWQSGWIIFTEKPDSFTYECYIGKVQQTMQVTVSLIDSEPETPTPIPTPNPNPDLGASEACEEHVLGTSSGVPACVNENGDLHICENNFPDDVFREYVANLEGGEDGYFTPEECVKILSINVRGDDVQTLQGIEFFINLFALDCTFNQLTELDISNNAALELLYCGVNQLEELDVSNNVALNTLACDNNQLTKLDARNNIALEVLFCDSNQLTELNISNNSALGRLYCSNNQLAKLDVRNNPALKILHCEDNQLTELDVRNNAALEDLDCYDNRLAELNLRNNTALKDLRCYGNQLTELDVRNNTALDYLVCYSNQLTKLDVNNNLVLTFLNCGNNQLTELDTSNNTALEDLYCYGNQLTKLDVTFNTKLQYLNCDNNQLTELVIIYYHKSLKTLSCNNNQLTSLYLGGGSELRSLECSNNQLTELNLSDKPGLNRLACADNQLTALDLSNCYYLYDLICYNNSITYIEDRANSRYIGQKVLEISPQTHTLPLMQKGSVWAVDLHALGDSRAIYGIRENSLSEGILDKSTGLVTFTEKPTSFTFESSSGARYLMQVVIHLTDTERPAPNHDLGASAACAGHVLDMFSGVPACVDTYGDLHICENNFPDNVFREYVANLQGAEDGYFSNIECNRIEDLSIKNAGIYTLKGIEFFNGIIILNCNWNNIISLDFRNNTALRTLECVGNPVESLNLVKNVRLEVLKCESAQIAELDLSNNTALKELHCSNNQLTDLNLKNNKALLTVDCGTNLLTHLDVSNNTALEALFCGHNSITELDVSNNTALRTLYCTDNQLSELDVSANTALTTLGCTLNRLTDLDVNNNQALQCLECSDNLLTDLDVARQTSLTWLYCANNRLTKLDVSKCPYLNIFDCSNNNLTELFLNDSNPNWYQLLVSPQNAKTPLVQGDDTWTADLSLLTPIDKITQIESFIEAEIDWDTGVLTFTEKPASIIYECYIGNIEQTMQVRVDFVDQNATYKATINGAEYEYAAGEQVTLSVDAFYLDGNWGYRFDTWTGDVDSVADVKSSTTTFTMPAQDVTITANHYLIGDVDGNGVVDSLDAANIIRMASGTMTPTLTGDITGTGVVDAMSVANIARYIAGTYTPTK